MLRLGYISPNITLYKKGIRTNRTCEKCVEKHNIKKLVNLFLKNLDDLEKIIKWNIKNNIFLFRLDENLAPHIICKKACTYGNLLYDPREIPEASEKLKKIGDLARKVNMRLSFHPGLYHILSNNRYWKGTKSNLIYYAIILDLLNLSDSIIILHGGGIYNNKEKAMETWIKNYKKLPEFVRKYIVLENDETRYSIKDVLEISRNLNYQLPIVLDIFHHYIYQVYHKIRIPVADVLPRIIETWKNKKMNVKMHISEQARGKKRGAHSDYVEHIPKWIFILSKHIKIDLMIEAGGEKALLYLRKKYKLKE